MGPVQLLWDTELFLRRQLQAVDEKDVDPNMFTQTNQTSEEDSHSRGRTVLTILYLCVLGLCFVVPVFYYFRLHCFEENVRRELEMDFTTALEQSEQHREENRAARRKYIEERRARIVQLFSPVRMTLKEENFPSLISVDLNASKRTGSFLNLDFESEKYSPGKSDNESATMASEEILSPYTSDEDEEHDETNHVSDQETNNNNNDNKGQDRDPQCQDTLKTNKQQQGVIATKCECDPDEENNRSSEDAGAQTEAKKILDGNPYLDEETVFVRIPVPGLPSGGSCLLDPTRSYTPEEMESREMRLAPGLCTICLCNYKVGSDIVWSSNEACDHHFHTSCIEKWLMKQREGPLCPCCRQDFIVDPLDLLEEDNNNIISSDDNENVDVDEETPTFLWNPETSEDDPNFGPVLVNAPGNVEGNISYNPAQLEEGLRSPPANEQTEGQRIEEDRSSAIHYENGRDDANEQSEGVENSRRLRNDEDEASNPV